MKAFLPVLLALFLTAPLYAQQTPIGACGAHPADFSVKRVASPSTPQQPPPGKALVYVIESMSTDVPFLTKKVDIGLDGNWLGATDADTYISFTLDPGIHHLCAIYQGQAHPLDDSDQTLLLHLDAKAGKTYYIRYKAFFMREQQGFAFFNKVDGDEGSYLLLGSEQAVSKLKK